MGLLDFEFSPVTNDSLKEGNWDAVVLVCENLDWDGAFNSSLAYLKPAIEDALKVSHTVMHKIKYCLSTIESNI